MTHTWAARRATKTLDELRRGDLVMTQDGWMRVERVLQVDGEAVIEGTFVDDIPPVVDDS